MARNNELAQSGSIALKRAIADDHISATELSRRTSGKVSDASIRSYLKGNTLPSVGAVWALSKALPNHTESILMAYGQGELLESIPPPSVPKAAYVIERDGFGRRTVPIGHKFSGEITSVVETSLGVEYTAVTDSGTMIRIIPFFAIDVAAESARRYVGDQSERATTE